MEDAHITITNLADDVALFGVFDGHGGMTRNLAIICNRTTGGVIRQEELA
jgi:hypothetical protein